MGVERDLADSLVDPGEEEDEGKGRGKGAGRAGRARARGEGCLDAGASTPRAQISQKAIFARLVPRRPASEEALRADAGPFLRSTEK